VLATTFRFAAGVDPRFDSFTPSGPFSTRIEEFDTTGFREALFVATPGPTTDADGFASRTPATLGDGAGGTVRLGGLVTMAVAGVSDLWGFRSAAKSGPEAATEAGD